MRVQLGECLKSIVLADFPDSWPALLHAVLRALASQVPVSILRQHCLFPPENGYSYLVTLQDEG